MELFYNEYLESGNSHAEIVGDEAKHITRVLRHKIGDRIFITNGRGLVSEVEIVSISKDRIQCKIISEKINRKKGSKIITLIPILHSKERFEFALEKLTELGVDVIQPFVSERTIKEKINFSRVQKILTSAIKQSLNPFLPELRELKSLNEILKKTKSDSTLIIGNPSGESIFQIRDKVDLLNIKEILICVGPEGDFTSEELNAFKNYNTFFINLSKNRLRSETAIILLTSLIKSSIDFHN